MSIALSEVLLLARQWSVDTDSTNPGNTDAELVRYANAWLHWMHDHIEERLTAVNASTSGLTTVSSGKYADSTAAYNDVRHAFLESSGTALLGTVLKREDLGKVLSEQARDAGTANPRIYALQRLSQATLSGTIGLIRIYIYPMLGSAHLSILHRPEPTALSASTQTDKPDLNKSECYILARGIAIEACLGLGRYDLAQYHSGFIPERIAVAAGLNQRFARLRRGEPLSG